MKYALLAPVLLGGEGSASGSSAVITALQSAMQSITSDITTTVTTVIPIIMGVVGLVLVFKFGKNFFRKNVQPN